MRLFIGLVVFAFWGFISINWYVCRIKGLCDDEQKVAQSLNSGNPATLDSNNTDTVTEEVHLKKDSIQHKKLQENHKQVTINKLNLYFNYNESKGILNNAINDSLKNLAEKLKTSEKPLVIEGHTDNMGTERRNIKLAKARAKWAEDLLISYGVDKNKLTIKAIGESQPIETNSNYKGRRKNRRVELIPK